MFSILSYQIDVVMTQLSYVNICLEMGQLRLTKYYNKYSIYVAISTNLQNNLPIVDPLSGQFGRGSLIGPRPQVVHGHFNV